MSFRYSSCFSFSSPNMRSIRTSENPMTAFSGVRSSCDMFARNSDLCWLATSSWRLFAPISRYSRAFWMARTDWLANVWRRSATSGGEAPAPCLLAPAHEGSQDLLLEEKRHRHHRPVAVPLERGPDASDIVGVLVQHIRDLERGPLGHRPSGDAFAETDRSDPHDLGQILVEAVGTLDVKFLRRAVVLVDDASVRGRNLRRPGHDGIEHCLELQRGADGLADLTERSKLIDEARQLPRASLQLDGHL